MPVTDKVEELLHVLGPFYEIVEDKKNKGSDLITGGNTKQLLSIISYKLLNFTLHYILMWFVWLVLPVI